MCSELELPQFLIYLEDNERRTTNIRTFSIMGRRPEEMTEDFLFDAQVLRAAPLVRAKVKFTVQKAVCSRRKLLHTAFLAVNFTIAGTSGAALSFTVTET